MTRMLLYMLLCYSWAASHAQQERPVFAPPSAHDFARYEVTMALNPFVLRTAPAPVARVSRAADWTLASVYGDAARPTVAVANMKTGQRVRLHSDGSIVEGMKLVRVKIGSSRKDMLAVVDFDGEHADLRYNMDWLRQAGASAAQRRVQPPRASPVRPDMAVALVPGRNHQEAPGAAALPVAAAGGASGLVSLPANSQPPAFAAAAGPQAAGAEDRAADAPGTAAAPDSPSDSLVWVPLASGAPVPLRRQLLRPAVLAPHPDPQ